MTVPPMLFSPLIPIRTHTSKPPAAPTFSGNSINPKNSLKEMSLKEMSNLQRSHVTDPKLAKRLDLNG